MWENELDAFVSYFFYFYNKSFIMISITFFNRTSYRWIFWSCHSVCPLLGTSLLYELKENALFDHMKFGYFSSTKCVRFSSNTCNEIPDSVFFPYKINVFTHHFRFDLKLTQMKKKNFYMYLDCYNALRF